MGGFPGSVLLNQGDTLKTTSDKRHPLGTRGYTRDGRVFRYARAGAVALTVGRLMQTAVALSPKNVVFYTAPTTASTKIALTMSTAAHMSSASFLDDGYLFTCDGTGEGQLHQIKKGVATTGSPTYVHLYEEDRFTTAVPTTASECGLIQNTYDDIIVCPKTLTGCPIGVTPRAVAATYYFWLQTWGPAAVRCNAAVVVGNAVKPDETTAGDVAPRTFSTKTAATSTKVINTLFQDVLMPVVGHVMIAAAAGEVALINLQLAS